MWGRGSLEDLQDGINRLFEQVWHSGLKTRPFDGQDWAPAVDVVDKPDRYIIELELPGVRNEDLEVTATASAITIQGQKTQSPTRMESDAVLASERRYGSFRRIIKVSEAIDSQRLGARLQHGVLIVEAPKTQPRRDPTVKVSIQDVS
jgi:HSP20 family protein